MDARTQAGGRVCPEKCEYLTRRRDVQRIWNHLMQMTIWKYTINMLPYYAYEPCGYSEQMTEHDECSSKQLGLNVSHSETIGDLVLPSVGKWNTGW